MNPFWDNSHSYLPVNFNRNIPFLVNGKSGWGCMSYEPHKLKRLAGF